MKLFLCGYHDVGCCVLDHVLSRADVSELAVFTHENPPHIRSVVAAAAAAGVHCTTQTVNDVDAWTFQPDVIASVYYRNIITPRVIDAVHGRIFNLHPSLLPRHRGCSSLTWAIIQGDPVAGITFHYIDPGVDTGRIILQAALQLSPQETQATLFNRAMHMGGAYWPAAFELVKAGFAGVPQEGDATRHPRATPHGGEINDQWPMEKIERFIRAMTFPPLPCATYRGREVKSINEYLTLQNYTVAADVNFPPARRSA